MPYAYQTVEVISKGPGNQGNLLGRAAVAIDFSVKQIAELTGASRQTVYNWMHGGDVLAPYRDRVERLTAILRSSTTAEKAWEKACKEFNLKA